MIDGDLDPLGFVTDELAARGALIDVDSDGALAVLPGEVARSLALPESVALAAVAANGVVGCGLGTPLLDRLVGEVRGAVPVAAVTWRMDPPRLPLGERFAERIVVRNGVADVLGVAHAAATYLAGVFAWTAEADDRYQGLTLAVAHAVSGGEPDDHAGAAMTALRSDEDASEDGTPSHAAGAVPTLAKRAALSLGSRLDEIGAAVARRRDRERARIDGYFTSLIAETRRPRRQVAAEALAARIAALRAEHVAKLRDLHARYTLRVRLEPVAFVAVATRVTEVRLRLRRRKGERELALHVPPGARAPDALACVACPATTRSPLLCDDALHVLCETCAPEAGGRPRCPACTSRRPR
jgi:hypothetical protein